VQLLLAVQHPLPKGFEIDVELLRFRSILIFFLCRVMPDTFRQDREFRLAVVIARAAVQFGN